MIARNAWQALAVFVVVFVVLFLLFGAAAWAPLLWMILVATGLGVWAFSSMEGYPKLAKILAWVVWGLFFLWVAGTYGLPSRW